MNRRGFLSALLTGVVAPAFLPGAGRKWITDKTTQLTVPDKRIIMLNPEYVNAPFEFSFFYSENTFNALLQNRMEAMCETGTTQMPNGIVIKDPYPIRTRDAEGKQVISPFIYAS